MKGKFSVVGDPDNRDAMFLTENGQSIPISYDGDAEQWITETSIALSNSQDIYINLAWAPKGIAKVGLGVVDS